MDKTWLVIGYLLILMTVVRAQSELPAVMGTFGISAGVTVALLSGVRQFLRADLERCQTSVADLTDKVNELLECPADYTQAVDDEKRCQTDLQGCEQEYFKTQESLSNAEADLEECQKSLDDITKFRDKVCDAYPAKCSCVEITNQGDCASTVTCTWDVAKQICKL
ncbi:uncharacterized protein LOC125666859 [Ostrea edulis]|uniref:uncharacterized protein LOC125666859 n=1 Tax=Ostrea edulis TaxID=37623 RepID=UPI0024AF380F|nr:uncharacterized protein LOC125666859 [Ostrea edulis]XP_056008031.1 uncharacterized protein LOC125666859 [Ostrea edulis]XP_056008032.1 uncharacterized protein LOC125666859 [Ostrea edulis]XP_056008033.1 uncharacterized protein LOC125666859 [Ostrea edulis]